MARRTLEQLFTAYGSDKHINGYTPLYESLFKNLRGQKLVLAEIGIGTMLPGVCSSMVGYAAHEGYKPGGSLRAWRDYFPDAQVHGIDVQPDTQFTDEDRITTHLCDSTNKAEATALLESAAFPTQVDVLIDDGNHADDSQLQTFYNFYECVKPGGFYIIEDIFPGSRIMTEMLPQIRAFAAKDGGRAFAAFLTDDLGGELNGGRTPILVITK